MSYKYSIGDIVQFKNWVNDMYLRKNHLVIENGVIVEKSNKLEHDWIVKSFNTEKLIHLKESWITKLN